MKNIWKKVLWVLPILFFVACGGGGSGGTTTENPNLKEVTVAINLPNNVGSKFNGLSSKRTNVFPKVSTITKMTIDVVDKDTKIVYNAYKMRYDGTRWTVVLLLDTTKAPFTFTVKGYDADGTLRYQGVRTNIQASNLSGNIEISVNRVSNDGESDNLPYLDNIVVSSLSSGKLNLNFTIGNPTKELVEYKLTTPKLPASCGSLFSPNQGSVKFTTNPTSAFDVLYSIESNQSCRANSHELTLTNVVSKNKVTILFSVDQGAITINFPPQVNSVKVVEDSSAGTLEFSVDATDPEGENISYKWGVTQGSLTSLSTSMTTPIWKAKRVDNKAVTVSIELKDEQNATALYLYKVQGKSATVTLNNYTPIKKTGQTKSYDENGTEVTDGSVKDDGFYQKGVTPNYTRDDVNNIVIDNITGLMWQDDMSNAGRPWLTSANYNSCVNDNNITACSNTSGYTATTYCSTLELGNYHDWRLPTIEEFETLIEYNSRWVNPIFQHFNGNNWSSTNFIYDKSKAWHIDFNRDGYLHYDVTKDYSHYVRCVRDR